MSGDLINQPAIYESAAKNLPEEKRDRIRVSGKAFALGVDYDVIDITYPTTTTEVFTYTLNTVTVRTIRLTYATAAKKDLTKVELL